MGAGVSDGVEEGGSELGSWEVEASVDVSLEDSSLVCVVVGSEFPVVVGA